jgi:DNA-binding NarL/FixJ family response regulator
MMNRTDIRVCVVEDNPDLLVNLRLLLGGEPGFVVVGAFPTAEAALAASLWQSCDVLLADIELPGLSGVDLIREVHRQHPHLQILVHTISDTRQTVFAALQAGALGYLLKGSSPRDLIESLRTLHTGGAPMSPRIARKVIQELHDIKPGVGAANLLTPRERDILGGIAASKSYKELAQQFSCSPHTIHGHVKKVYEKLHASNRAEALEKAHSLGVL